MDFEGNTFMFNPIFTVIGYIQRSNIENHVQGSRTVTHTELDNFTACSPVLDTWLRWNPELKRPGRKTPFPFPNNQNAVKVLTDYMKGHEVMISGDVLPEVLSLGDMLQVDEITNYCKHLILNEPLTVDNCLSILKLCSLYNIEHPKIDKFIRGKLTELSQMEDMLCITRDSLDILLTDEELSYWPMNDRFVFISAWCNAQEDRSVYFETLFKQLDLYKIDRDFIEVVIKNDILVSESKLCLDLINMHLCDKKDQPVPYVFVLNVRRLESNVLGFNLEDEQLYQFRFPDQVVDSSLLTVAESGHILSIKKTSEETYLYDFDVNSNRWTEKMLQMRKGHLATSDKSNKCTKKMLQMRKGHLATTGNNNECTKKMLQMRKGHLAARDAIDEHGGSSQIIYERQQVNYSLIDIPEVSHILDAQGRLILIDTKSRENHDSILYQQVSNNGKSSDSRRKQCSILYQQLIDNGKPCDSRRKRRKECSVLYQQVSENGRSIRIEPICTLLFNVAAACFSQSMIIMSSSTFENINQLFFFHLKTYKLTVTELQKMIHIDVIIPFKTKLFLSSRHTSCIFDLVTSSTEYIIKNEHDNRFPLSTRYVFLSKSIIRIDHNDIKILNVENERQFTHYFHSEQLKLDNKNKVAIGYLDRKRKLCHIMCPHCDPNAWEREEEERRRRNTQSNDDRNESYDDFNEFNYNVLNGLEHISDGSENESV